MEYNNNSEHFSPEFQDKFWGALEPDVRLFFDKFEQREDWTYTYNEIPEVFTALSNALPQIIDDENVESAKEVLHSLIVLLSSLPLRECIYAIGWLDREAKEQYQIGWGVRLYIEAESIYNDNPDSHIFLHAKVIRDRVKVIIQSSLSSELFCNINVMGDFI
ncbi:hypothetical protein D3C87_351710 [compost metagenome]